MMRALCVVGVGVLAIGCGDDGESDTTDTRQPEAETQAETSSETETTPLTGEVEGRWAMVETQSAFVTTKTLGTVTQTSVSYYLADFAADNLSLTLCDWLTDDETGFATTRMGNNVLASLAPLVRTYEVTADGPGFKLTTGKGYALRGVELEHVATDPMPTDGANAAVRDQDGDGQPGITLVVQGLITGQLYVAHRHIAELDGALESDTRISGLTDWTTEQIIFGSNPQALADENPVAVTDPNASKSHFVMVKVDAAASCTSIMADRATLFPE